MQAPARPRLPVVRLTALAGLGSPDAADTLACLPWLRVVHGPPRHGEGRPGAALLARLGVLSALCAWSSVVPLERSRSSQVPEAEPVASFPVPSDPLPRATAVGGVSEERVVESVREAHPASPVRRGRLVVRRRKRVCWWCGDWTWWGVLSPWRRAEPALWRLASRGAAVFFARHAVLVSACRGLAGGAKLPVGRGREHSVHGGAKGGFLLGSRPRALRIALLCLSLTARTHRPPPGALGCQAFGTPFRGARTGGGARFGWGRCALGEKAFSSDPRGCLGVPEPPAAAPPLRVVATDAG